MINNNNDFFFKFIIIKSEKNIAKTFINLGFYKNPKKY